MADTIRSQTAKIQPEPSENTPLLDTPTHTPRRWISPVTRVLFVSLLTSTSFAFTQTSLMYSFRMMTCEEYYKSHTWTGHGDRCALPYIEAKTAKSIAYMSTNTTFCSILNLFVTGYWFKILGIKPAMWQQTIWAALRNLTQIYALKLGGQQGINIITITQAFNILGSAGGYQLAANAYIAVLVEGKDKTAGFGQLAGVSMFGMAIGFSLGGQMYELGGRLLPFQIAFVLLVTSTIFSLLFLPSIPRTSERRTSSTDSTSTQPSEKSPSFLAPLKIFIPSQQPRLELEGGARPLVGNKRDWNVFLLGSGAFLSVLATGYQGTGLQLLGTNVFGFTPGKGGLMQSLTLCIRAFFLSVMFPGIISRGRSILSAKSTGTTSSPVSQDAVESGLLSSTSLDDPSSPMEAEASFPFHPPQPETAPQLADVPHGSQFDLYFLRYSILLDGILTSLVSFSDQGWHLFLAASVLPFASGTGSACKGVVMECVADEDKESALSAIALVEKIAQISTITLFGAVFAALSEAGIPTFVFLANGAIAILAFVVLCFVRMPRVRKVVS